MYQRMLVTLDHSSTDEAILEHIEALARSFASEVLLLHVADGWVARNYERLGLRESEEMQEDRRYLAEVTARLQKKGISTSSHLALGEPADEIIRFARERDCDLIAMSTHGHRFIADFILGSTADKVRHEVDVPVLLLKAPAEKKEKSVASGNSLG